MSIRLLYKYGIMKSELLIGTLLEHLGIPHTTRYVERLFHMHPYRYTMYGLKAILSHYGVLSEAVRIEDTENALDSLQGNEPFVVQLLSNLVVVTEIGDEDVFYIQYGLLHRASRDTFLYLWTGVALFPVSINDNAGEPDLKKHIKEERIDRLERIASITAITALLLTIGIITGAFTCLWLLPQLLLCIAGCWFSSMLMAKSLKIDVATGDRICNMIKGHSCNNILELPVAKMFGRYGWGEIGTAYFTAYALTILSFPNAAFSVLPYASMIAVVYPAWSIWYQKFRAKKWCALCLGVQAVLIAQFILGIVQVSLSGHTLPTAADCAIFILASLSVGALVHFGVLKAAELRKGEYASRELSLIKFKDEVVEALFSQKEEIDTSSSSIVFGDPSSKFEITVYSNPYCSPCSKIHPKISALLDAGCRVRYYLTAFNDELLPTTHRLMEYYRRHGWRKTWDLFEKWYSGGSGRGDGFFDGISMEISDETLSESEVHMKWGRDNKMEGTPILLVNGRRIPREYNIDDLISIVKFHKS